MSFWIILFYIIVLSFIIVSTMSGYIIKHQNQKINKLKNWHKNIENNAYNLGYSDGLKKGEQNKKDILEKLENDFQYSNDKIKRLLSDNERILKHDQEVLKNSREVEENNKNLLKQLEELQSSMIGDRENINSLAKENNILRENKDSLTRRILELESLLKEREQEISYVSDGEDRLIQTIENILKDYRGNKEEYKNGRHCEES